MTVDKVIAKIIWLTFFWPTLIWIYVEPRLQAIKNCWI